MARATVIAAVALVVLSCRGKIKNTLETQADEKPMMTMNDMFIVQTDKGKMKVRVSAGLMERFQNDTASWERFSGGVLVYAYKEDGKLETELRADKADHHDDKKQDGGIWRASGNVSVKNLINRQTLLTDTLFWNQEDEKIYTHCYVCIVSPDGFMQGYGMESDQRARHSTLLHPFNSYGIMSNDSTAIVLDTVNFTGPFPKKESALQKND